MLLNKLLNFFPIRWIFMFLITSVFFLSILFSSYLEFTYEMKTLENEKLKEVCSQSVRISEITEYLLNKKEISFLDRFYANISLDPNISNLLLISPEEKVLLSIRRKYINKSIKDIRGLPSFIKVRNKIKNSLSCFLADKGYEIVSIATVKFPSENSIRPTKTGYLFISYNLKNVKQKWKYMIIGKLSGEIGVLLLLLGSIYFFFNKLISERLEKIIAVSQKIARGNLDLEIDLRGKDEFSLIANVINILLSRLKKFIKYDYLTGIYNRLALEKEINRKIKQFPNSKHVFIFIDLDNFKDINDTFGHNFGDKVLKYFAKRLKDVCKQEDFIIGRLGGDEFIVYTRDKSPDYFKRRCFDKLSGTYNIGNISINLTLTAGVSISSNLNTNFYHLLKESDLALFYGKKQGKDMFVVYDNEIRLKEERKLKIKRLVNKALENREFYIVYQPIYDVKQKRYTSVEALLRWKNGFEGEISPSDFIPILEETGRIKQVGKWVLEEVCKQIKIWNEKNIKLKVSVNVDIQQLLEEDFIDFVRLILEKYKIDAESLIFEITETEAMRFPKKVLSSIKQLRKLGINIAIDDFGTGYSSLSYLKLIPLDYLKIDKIFIKDIPLDKKTAMLISTIIDMAKNFGFKVVAEGVETKEQYEFLEKIGCDKVQGFLISKPGLPSKIEELVMKANLL